MYNAVTQFSKSGFDFDLDLDRIQDCDTETQSVDEEPPSLSSLSASYSCDIALAALQSQAPIRPCRHDAKNSAMLIHLLRSSASAEVLNHVSASLGKCGHRSAQMDVKDIRYKCQHVR